MAAALRALSFGSVAELYEHYRPDYPDALVDTVVGHATRPVRSALELGAGTGKATRTFAARGIEVAALEPDPEMVAVLRRTTHGLPVEALRTTFEGYRGARAFDLVYAAAAWHWMDPKTRVRRAAALLAPGGVLALIGGSFELADPDLRARVDRVEREFLDDEAGGPSYAAAELEESPNLTDITEVELPRTLRTAAAHYVGRLATVSAYLMLDTAARADALRRIAALLPSELDIDAPTQLLLARRATR